VIPAGGGRVAHPTIVIWKSGGCPVQAPLGRARWCWRVGHLNGEV